MMDNRNFLGCLRPRRRRILLVPCLLAFLWTMASAEMAGRKGRFSLYGELFGNGIMGSLNVEYMATNRVALRIGVMPIGSPSPLVIAMVNVLKGKNGQPRAFTARRIILSRWNRP